MMNVRYRVELNQTERGAHGSLEPLLRAICDFLDKQPALIERVRRDLVRGLKKPDKGRRGSPRRRCCAHCF
jgi:hypothetical protein